jgi:hypothetical protein
MIVYLVIYTYQLVQEAKHLYTCSSYQWVRGAKAFLEANKMSEKQKKQILEIVKKVCLKTLDHVKGQTHLETVRHDQNKEFEQGENAEREYVLKIINSEIKHLETLKPELFDCMFLLKKDLEEVA